MDLKKFFATVLGYTIVTFVLAYVWHIVLFYDVYIHLGIFTRLQNPVFALGLFATILQGCVIAYLYPRFTFGKRSFVSSFVFSYAVGLFMISVAVIALAAKSFTSSLATWFVIEIAFHFIQFTAVGFLLGFLYND